jgi:glycerol-3-phosphate dehydrogenase (NAD(P)+)
MKIGVIGGGSLGTALAMVSYRASQEAQIYVRDKNICNEINQNHTNSRYLPNITLPSKLIAYSDLSKILDSDALLLAVPAQTIHTLCLELKALNLDPNKIIVICSKGIEQNSLKLMSEVVSDVLPKNPIAILSGPNFAIEIAQDLPAITSLASTDRDLANALSKFLGTNNFRIYPNTDIIGTQVIGAAKNVLAIAIGAAIGKKYGENSKAAIVSRGVSEISNLLLAKGGKIETLLSPAGIGDIYLTCSSAMSRNTSYGILLGQNKTTNPNDLVEGFYTSESIMMLAAKLSIKMPVCHAVYKIAHEKLSLDRVVQDLLDRPVEY